MRQYFDTEFMSQPGSLILLSIGIVDQNGREFYAENGDADTSRANEFVRQNVLPMLGVNRQAVMAYNDIGPAVNDFVGADVPEWWAHHNDSDFVLLMWLFGQHEDVPEGWPTWCHDTKQLQERVGNPDLPPDPTEEHHALADAWWTKEAVEFMDGLLLENKL